MIRVSYMNPLRATLGFFHQGIPVVFIKNDVLFRKSNAADHYLKLIGDDGAKKTGTLFDDDAALAFNRFATLLHELRHFHDALLCRPLFEQFLRQHKITWNVMQALNRLARLRYIPTGANDPIWRSDSELAILKQLINEADEETFDRSPGLHGTGMIESEPISLEYLLEASALTTELLHLYAVHGVEATEHYYKKIVLKTDRLYRVLLEKLVALFRGDIVRGIDALYCILAISLYGSDHPVDRFVSLYEGMRENKDLLRTETDQWQANPFPNEEELTRRVSQEILIDHSSREPIAGSRLIGHEFPLDELANLHQTLYTARRTLIERYVKQGKYSANFYVEHLYEFPSPPILVDPVEADSSATIVPAIPESDLEAGGSRYYVISGVESEEGIIVLAGLRDFPSAEPFMSFGVADEILFANFCHRYLFEGQEQQYSRGVDDMYIQTLKRIILNPS